MDEVLDLDLARVASMLRRREISPVELATAALARIGKLDRQLCTFITVMREAALDAARIAESEIMRGAYRGALHGVPIALKDVISTAGVRTTNGSRIFTDSIPPTDATVVSRLKNAGAVIIGKNNLHEFAMGSTTANPYFGICRNPWNLDHVPGGSSGGSAAAVAAGLCFGAIGSDTAGSIRSPAAQCGVVGLKPTAGLVSTSGVFPVSSTLDHVGPLARTVTDVALILHAIADCNPVGETSAGLSGIKVGIPTSFFFDGISAEIERLVRDAIGALRGLGASVAPLAWPQAAEAAEAVLTIVGFESARLHRPWLDSRGEDYSPELRARLENAARIPHADYERARAKVDPLRKDFLSIMKTVDVIAAPTNPVPAPRHGQTHVRIGDEDLPIASVMPRLGAPQNLTGCPAVSVPCGFAGTGVPVGLQLIGRPFEEATVLRIAHAYEVTVRKKFSWTPTDRSR